MTTSSAQKLQQIRLLLDAWEVALKKHEEWAMMAFVCKACKQLIGEIRTILDDSNEKDT